LTRNLALLAGFNEIFCFSSVGLTLLDHPVVYLQHGDGNYSRQHGVTLTPCSSIRAIIVLVLNHETSDFALTAVYSLAIHITYNVRCAAPLSLYRRLYWPHFIGRLGNIRRYTYSANFRNRASDI